MHVEVLPAASVAVYVTIVVPTLKVLPGTRVLVIVPPLQLSVNVGALQLTIAWQDAFALAMISEGQFMIAGLTLSTTVTLNEQIEELPAGSVAV